MGAKDPRSIVAADDEPRAAGAVAVFDDELLAEDFRELACCQPAADVGEAARHVRYHRLSLTLSPLTSFCISTGHGTSPDTNGANICGEHLRPDREIENQVRDRVSPDGSPPRHPMPDNHNFC
jgi:hypothetical protein